MKKIFFTIALSIFTSIMVKAQTNIVDVNSGISLVDSPSGTYVKDLNNTFTPYIGSWKYQNGNEILIIKLEKVTKYYDSKYGSYEDHIKGNYSYTTNNGATFVTNTIVSNLSNTDPNINSFYSPGPYSTHLDMSFTDEVRNVRCDAIFTFLPSSTNQLNLKVNNRSRGYIYPEVPPSNIISIPNNVVLTKQP